MWLEHPLAVSGEVNRSMSSHESAAAACGADDKTSSHIDLAIISCTDSRLHS
jgi:hypothetical protein